jgi:type IX secretion system PorP/SprF family membrane protein
MMMGIKIQSLLLQFRVSFLRMIPIWLAFLSQQAMAQDAQFSQYFAAPVLTNPAFAGNMEFDCKDLKSNIKATMNNRRQWGNFHTDALTGEYFNKKKKIGLAFIAQNQRISNAKFQNTSFGLVASYKLALNSEWSFNSGLQLSVANRSLGFSNLRFTDQFNDEGFTGKQTIDNVKNTASIFYPDIAAGGIFYTKDFWSGLSLHHINMPNISNLGYTERRPIRISVQGGYKFEFRSNRSFGNFKKDISLKPVYQLRIQGPYSQLDFGMYYTNEPFVAGIMYRGFPVGKQGADNLVSQDAAIVLLGYKQDGFKLGYSFDMGLSKIGLQGGGSHEISLSYQYAKKGCRRRKAGKFVPIPAF